jgi:hypothetical protein
MAQTDRPGARSEYKYGKPALRALCANFEAGGAEAIDGDDEGGVLQNALNPLMLLRAECCGFAAIPFACLQIMQPSKLMTRVRFPSPAPRLKIKGLSEILRELNAH